jgi:hypothetical protein
MSALDFSPLVRLLPADEKDKGRGRAGDWLIKILLQLKKSLPNLAELFNAEQDLY